MTIGKIRVPLFCSLFLWAALWEVVGQSGASFIIPPLSAIFERMAEIVPTASFASALWITAKAFLLGNLIAIGLGVPLGVLMGRSIIADRIFLPWVNLFLSAPLTALVPVIMVIFGLGETTIIMTVVLFAVWIIVLDARAGVRAISPSLVEMARCFGASRWQAFSKIYLLAALPEILAGIRLGMIRAVKGVVIGQLLVSIIGFGKLFELYSSRFLMEHFWALLFVLFAFAFTLNEVLAWLERKLDYYAAARQ
ncbi:ABC transporter permease subunit [Pelagibius litoralis]|uniref:ABC transporter permease subunit n=1 Tax=Pelagibius litoralis TaxID=374515 RepID=A0A967KAD0_9PROT|nr:ABC transporter permease subunit [Pelagibius litoralis]NIA70407.1 ABC transporter permease subunit [Pelagibius litoralis]